MIELDIINPSETLRFYIEHIWPDDYTLYIYDEGEHYRLQCDQCSFWDGNYTISLYYDGIALIRLCLYKGGNLNKYEMYQKIKGGYIDMIVKEVTNIVKCQIDTLGLIITDMNRKDSTAARITMTKQELLAYYSLTGIDLQEDPFTKEDKI